MANNNEYTAEKITVLKGLEAVKKRPAMYIGDVTKKGLHHLIWEVVDNCIDETLAGYCTEINVEILPEGGVSVKDNGRGIPVEKHKDEGISALELVMTVLHAGGKFDKNTYKVSGGLHGVGVSVVNALSKKCIVEVERDKNKYQQEFEHGIPKNKVRPIDKTKNTGTKVTFYPNYEIFKNTIFEFEIIDEKLRELAYLNEGLKITLKDDRDEEIKESIHHYKGGLSEFVKHLDTGHKPLFEKPISFSGEKDDVQVQLALRHNHSYTENLLTFVNNINTIEGGTHLAGFRAALTRSLNRCAHKNKFLKPIK